MFKPLTFAATGLLLLALSGCSAPATAEPADVPKAASERTPIETVFAKVGCSFDDSETSAVETPQSSVGAGLVRTAICTPPGHTDSLYFFQAEDADGIDAWYTSGDLEYERGFEKVYQDGAVAILVTDPKRFSADFKGMFTAIG